MFTAIPWNVTPAPHPDADGLDLVLHAIFAATRGDLVAGIASARRGLVSIQAREGQLADCNRL
jgi:hypothetical protein